MDSAKRDELLDLIADLETEMFLELSSEGGPSPAQQKPEIFRLTRRMAHAAHGVAFLESLLADLRAARQAGRNVLKEKYERAARGEAPVGNPVADAIADVEAGFLAQAGEKFPQILKGGNSQVFRRYLRHELDFLSTQSLQLYAQELQEAADQGRNPAIERHNWLAGKLGQPLLRH